MTIPLGSMSYTQGQGSKPETVEIPFYTTRDPNTSDQTFPVGKRWINQSTNTEWVLTSFTSYNKVRTANWTSLTVQAGTGITSIDVDTGTSPVIAEAGNISILGDSQNITTIGFPGVIEVSLNDTISVNSLTLTGPSGRLIITDQSTSTSSIGNCQLSAGAVTVHTSACTSTSLIFITPTFYQGTVGEVYVSNVSNGSFTLTSQDAGDETYYNYMIIGT